MQNYRGPPISMESLTMASHATHTERIIEAVRKGAGDDLDTLTRNLPDLTWKQIFSEIDRLSRTGQILVTCKPDGRYSLQVLPSGTHRT